MRAERPRYKTFTLQKTTDGEPSTNTKSPILFAGGPRNFCAGSRPPHSNGITTKPKACVRRRRPKFLKTPIHRSFSASWGNLIICW